MSIDRSDEADARRLRWMLNGNGGFMEEHSLCCIAAHSCAEDQDEARQMIDKAMCLQGVQPKTFGEWAAQLRLDLIEALSVPQGYLEGAIVPGDLLCSRKLDSDGYAAFRRVDSRDEAGDGEFVATVILCNHVELEYLAVNSDEIGDGVHHIFHLAPNPNGDYQCHQEDISSSDIWPSFPGYNPTI